MNISKLLIALALIVSTCSFAAKLSERESYIRTLLSNSTLAPSKKIEAYRAVVGVLESSGITEASTKQDISKALKSSPGLKGQLLNLLGASDDPADPVTAELDPENHESACENDPETTQGC